MLNGCAYILTVDVGNTFIRFGLFAEDSAAAQECPLATCEITTPSSITADEARMRLVQGMGALSADAGMPGVSDPGYRLIQTLKEKEVSFTVLPGPSAVVTALVGSGLPTDAFFFGGFLPVKSGRKGSMLQAAVEASHTSIFYESPHRIVKTVQALAALDPDVPVCVARELTKTFETYHRGPASRLAAEFAERAPKGEIVLLVGGVNAPRAVN